jgi:hypothetical protein
MPPAKILIATQGDDLGANHSANMAFVEAYRHGTLRNAAVIACCPAIEEAAQLLAAEKGLCFALHTCMNAEWDSERWGPVAGAGKVPSLVDGRGHFFQTGTALWENKPNIDHVFIELQAQLDRARGLGFDIRFADAHMGWTWILKEQAPRFEEWKRKNGIRDHKPYGHLPKIGCMADPVEHLILQLRRAAPGQYWVGGHPSYDNTEMRALGHPGFKGDMVGISREWERKIFTDPRIVEYCREAGVQPIRHDEAL